MSMSLFFFAEPDSKGLFLKTYTAVLEILRLAAWNFFTIEHEHVKRYRLFNLTKQFQFPFELDLNLNYKSEDFILTQKILSASLWNKARYSNLLIPFAFCDPHLQIENYKKRRFGTAFGDNKKKPRQKEQLDPGPANVTFGQNESALRSQQMTERLASLRLIRDIIPRFGHEDNSDEM